MFCTYLSNGGLQAVCEGWLVLRLLLKDQSRQDPCKFRLAGTQHNHAAQDMPTEKSARGTYGKMCLDQREVRGMDSSKELNDKHTSIGKSSRETLESSTGVKVPRSRGNSAEVSRNTDPTCDLWWVETLQHVLEHHLRGDKLVARVDLASHSPLELHCVPFDVAQAARTEAKNSLGFLFVALHSRCSALGIFHEISGHIAARQTTHPGLTKSCTCDRNDAVPKHIACSTGARKPQT